MRTALSPIVVLTGARGYTAAQSTLGIARSVRLQLSKAATAADTVAVFTVPDATFASGTATGNFSGADPTTWPPGATHIATIAGNEVVSIPDEAWGGCLVVLRVSGSTACNLLASGEGSQTRITIAAPTTLAHHTAPVDISSVAWPAQAEFDKTALASDEAKIYLSDDSTIASGGGALDGAQYVGKIVGQGRPLPLPRPSIGTRLIVERTVNTVARNVFVTGQSSGENSLGGTDIAITASGNVVTTAGNGITNTAGGGYAVSAVTTVEIAGATVAIEANDGLMSLAGNSLSIQSLDTGIAIEAASSVAISAESSIALSTTTDEIDVHAFGDLTLRAGGDVHLTPGATGFVAVKPRGAAAGDAGQIKLLELAANGAHGVVLRGADSIPADLTLTLPSTDGVKGAMLRTDGAGVLAFESPPAGHWGADNGVVTAAEQWLGAGTRSTAVLTATGGILQASDRSVSKFRAAFVGDAANAAGQTISAKLYKNGVLVPGSTISGIATTAGAQSGVATFTPVDVANGDRLTVTFTPSALLSAVYTSAVATAK